VANFCMKREAGAAAFIRHEREGGACRSSGRIDREDRESKLKEYRQPVSMQEGKGERPIMPFGRSSWEENRPLSQELSCF